MESDRTSIAGPGSKNLVPAALITAGIIALVIGSVVAVSGANDERTVDDLETDCKVISDLIIGTGTISINTFDPQFLTTEEPDLFQGRSACIKISTLSGSTTIEYIPDLETFRSHGSGKEERGSRTIPVNMNDGRIVPGELEVILREG